MAFLQAFIDPAGNEYEAAHWRAVQINIAAPAREIVVTFYAYRSLQAFLEGKQSLAGAVKSYQITGAAFQAVAMGPPVGATRYEVLANAAEDHALATLDTPTGQIGPDNKPVLASFFAKATRV